jgi:hypothetical protein
MKDFPVLDGGSIASVPWAFVASHERQAQENHSQSLEELASRGGCSPDEILAIVGDRPWFPMLDRDAIEALASSVVHWTEAGGGSMIGVAERLRSFLGTMHYKLDLRKKRPPDPAKWPLDAVDLVGNRDWHKCSLEFLRKKLEEETAELFEPGADVRLEAADVALVAFMIADHPDNNKGPK